MNAILRDPQIRDLFLQHIGLSLNINLSGGDRMFLRFQLPDLKARQTGIDNRQKITFMNLVAQFHGKMDQLACHFRRNDRLFGFKISKSIRFFVVSLAGKQNGQRQCANVFGVHLICFLFTLNILITDFSRFELDLMGFESDPGSHLRVQILNVI